MLTCACPVFTRPAYSSIFFGLLPADWMIFGRSISVGMSSIQQQEVRFDLNSPPAVHAPHDIRNLGRTELPHQHLHVRRFGSFDDAAGGHEKELAGINADERHFHGGSFEDVRRLA